jgi:hypothetical protein
MWQVGGLAFLLFIEAHYSQRRERIGKKKRLILYIVELEIIEDML